VYSYGYSPSEKKRVEFTWRHVNELKNRDGNTFRRITDLFGDQTGVFALDVICRGFHE